MPVAIWSEYPLFLISGIPIVPIAAQVAGLEPLKATNIEQARVIAANEIRNIDLVKKICVYLDKHFKKKKEDSFLNLIKFVKDRPGHDQRYSINSKKLEKELKWKPSYNFDRGLKLTIDWYLNKFS